MTEEPQPRWHRRTDRPKESPVDRAVRRTAYATIALAITSVLTICVLWNQLSEMRLENRAWVGVDGLISFDFKASPNFSVPFDVTNTGKTPALDVTMRATSKSRPKGEKFTATYSAPYSETPSVSVIQPQMHTILPTLPGPVTTAQYDSVKDGPYILYVYGNITYKDIYKHAHETDFCVMYYHGLTTPVTCGYYNTAN